MYDESIYLSTYSKILHLKYNLKNQSSIHESSVYIICRKNANG